ncbi:hypothetical protein C0J52_24342 [Blattella germanica]|nr:hypothetical protein C0J52_24342 [Blattella germanica]
MRFVITLSFSVLFRSFNAAKVLSCFPCTSYSRPDIYQSIPLLSINSPCFLIIFHSVFGISCFLEAQIGCPFLIYECF